MAKEFLRLCEYFENMYGRKLTEDEKFMIEKAFNRGYTCGQREIMGRLFER
nr:MAG TPA: hypothetical protein [Caudoviricetes sp.]